jgi:hypothetical protein
MRMSAKQAFNELAPGRFQDAVQLVVMGAAEQILAHMKDAAEQLVLVNCRDCPAIPSAMPAKVTFPCMFELHGPVGKGTPVRFCLSPLVRRANS